MAAVLAAWASSPVRAQTYAAPQGEALPPLPPISQAESASAQQASAQQIAELQAQIDQLRREIQWRQNAPGPAAIEPQHSPQLTEDVAHLLEWQRSVEQAEAKAAAKTALRPSVKIGGRFFFDAANFSQNDASFVQSGDAEDGLALRWAWIELGGNVMENTTYRIWFDLSAQVSLQDVYLDFGELPLVQNVRIGHFFEPFGMEQLTANKYMTFMERTSPFIQGRNMGVMAHSDNAEANWTYGVGLFVSEQGSKPPFFQNDNDASAVTGRLTWLPWYDELTDGRSLFHMGAGYSFRNLADNTVRFSNQPESYLAPEVVDTGDIAADHFQLYGLEAAYAYGSLMVQSEYHLAAVDTFDQGNETFHHYYVQVSYFLTGENRPYNRRAGSFSNRVVPLENFFRVRTETGQIGTGWGAWEVAYRYAHDDLNSDNILGGVTSRHNCGLNWYLSPFTRAMFEYVYSDTDTLAATDGQLHIWQMRLQFDF